MNSFALFTPVQTSRVLSLPSALTTADTHTPKEQNDPSESTDPGSSVVCAGWDRSKVEADKTSFKSNPTEQQHSPATCNKQPAAV